MWLIYYIERKFSFSLQNILWEVSSNAGRMRITINVVTICFEVGLHRRFGLEGTLNTKFQSPLSWAGIPSNDTLQGWKCSRKFHYKTEFIFLWMETINLLTKRKYNAHYHPWDVTIKIYKLIPPSKTTILWFFLISSLIWTSTNTKNFLSQALILFFHH